MSDFFRPWRVFVVLAVFGAAVVAHQMSAPPETTALDKVLREIQAEQAEAQTRKAAFDDILARWDAAQRSPDPAERLTGADRAQRELRALIANPRP